MAGWCVTSPNLLPREGVVVETKIDDGRGIRNQTLLKYDSGLWFYPDGNNYVYYTPTHWRYV